MVRSVIGRLRRWIARAVAVLVTVFTLGRLSVEYGGVTPATAADEERPAVTALEGRPDEPDV